MITSSTAVATHPRLSVQAFWLMLSKLIAALLQIDMPMLLVRLLSQVEYDVFKQAFLFTSTATSIAAMGIGMSAFYFIPRHPERGGQIALNNSSTTSSPAGYRWLCCSFIRKYWSCCSGPTN